MPEPVGVAAAAVAERDKPQLPLPPIHRGMSVLLAAVAEARLAAAAAVLTLQT